MRLPLTLLVWLGAAVTWAAPPNAAALGARLGLADAPGLELSVVGGDADTVRYQVTAPETLPAVAAAARAHLIGRGWLEHPNVREPAAPAPGVRVRLNSYVQGSELLELQTSQRSGRAGTLLEATLTDLGGPPQLASAP